MDNSVDNGNINELRNLPFSDIRRGGRLIDVLTRKLQELDENKFQDQLLEHRVRLLLALLTETLADRFQNLSLLAFAHMIVALDYFLRVDDSLPDTMDGGYSDDLKVVQKVFTDFETEINAFKAWQAKQPKDDAF